MTRDFDNLKARLSHFRNYQSQLAIPMIQRWLFSMATQKEFVAACQLEELITAGRGTNGSSIASARDVGLPDSTFMPATYQNESGGRTAHR